ncbi:hypothetical protein N7470_003834 [Penicillium chermesinum]|nr:hypothetical protein N7470_003834 [Penicillium chermesinum]
MNIPNLPPFQSHGAIQPITCVEMHTAGEPTRIIWTGFPNLTGTLLEQREQAKAKHDDFRRLLMLEPRGHYDMYGAILCPETELVDAGQADIGVLFMHNDGFSTMCGHATIALGRFLVDADEAVFPRRQQLERDRRTGTTSVKLHAPCGVVEITVPTLASGQSDPARPVSFVSVPSFATALSLTVELPETHRWPELQGRTSVTADFALLKDAVISNPDLEYVYADVETGEPGFLYSIMITDKSMGLVKAAENTATCRAQQGVASEETGLCFFANQQIDRSPTGGCVAARVALAHAKGDLGFAEKRMYNSLVTRGYKGVPGFVGSAVDQAGKKQSIRVKVEGYAYYTGYHAFVLEKEDGIGLDGFSLKDLKLQ